MECSRALSNYTTVDERDSAASSPKTKIASHAFALSRDGFTYNCQFCTETFASTTAAAEHLRKYVVKLAYSCSICKSKFCRQSDLKSHNAFHAACAKAFRCPVCFKFFTSIRHYIEHRKQHYEALVVRNDLSSLQKDISSRKTSSGSSDEIVCNVEIGQGSASGRKGKATRQPGVLVSLYEDEKGPDEPRNAKTGACSNAAKVTTSSVSIAQPAYSQTSGKMTPGSFEAGSNAVVTYTSYGMPIVTEVANLLQEQRETDFRSAEKVAANPETKTLRTDGSPNTITLASNFGSQEEKATETCGQQDVASKHTAMISLQHKNKGDLSKAANTPQSSGKITPGSFDNGSSAVAVDTSSGEPVIYKDVNFLQEQRKRYVGSKLQGALNPKTMISILRTVNESQNAAVVSSTSESEEEKGKETCRQHEVSSKPPVVLSKLQKSKGDLSDLVNSSSTACMDNGKTEDSVVSVAQPINCQTSGKAVSKSSLSVTPEEKVLALKDPVRLLIQKGKVKVTTFSSSIMEAENTKGSPVTTTPVVSGDAAASRLLDFIYKCGFCGDSYCTAAGLEKHRLKHFDKSSNFNFNCYECGLWFQIEHNLSLHKKTHNPALLRVRESATGKDAEEGNDKSSEEECFLLDEGGKRYQCQHCSAWFTHKSVFELHERKHREPHLSAQAMVKMNEDREKKAALAAEKLNMARQLRKKVEIGKPQPLCRRRERRHLCDRCGSAFVSLRLLREHSWRHTGIKPFGCSECGKRYTAEASLEEHKRIHTGERPYSCLVCSKSFRARSALNYHKITHEKYRPHLCHVCGKGFAREYNLKWHARIHDPPHLECGQCHAMFRTKPDLYQHVKIHGPPHLECGQCHAKFRTNASLYQHKRRHEEPRHLCSVCEKKFHSRAELRIHMRKHDNGQ